MKKALLILVIFYFSISCKKDNPTNPQDDKYESVTIGTQTWMTKNLDVDHYRNGDSIPEVRDSVAWLNITTGAWCYYNNDPALGKIYGKLYNWYAVNDPRGIAPAGLHVPSTYEWEVLVSNLGGDYLAYMKLKEAGTSHWLGINIDATNESGFTAIPGGYRSDDAGTGRFDAISYNADFWTSTIYYFDYPKYACYRGIFYNSNSIYRGASKYNFGASVRCIKD